jgi:hypothetical protein
MDDVYQTLGMFCLWDAVLLLTAVSVLIQQLASDINKARRACDCPGAIAEGAG